MRTLSILLLLASSTAAAEERPIAIAVNNPILWAGDKSIAASLYHRVANKQAVRLNFARYEYKNFGQQMAADIRYGFEAESEYDYTGRAHDIGAAWMYFPRRLWDGPTLEAGVLLRRVESRGTPWDAYDYYTVRDRSTNTYSARGLVGWSWLMYNRAFIAFAVGASSGYTVGDEELHEQSRSQPVMTTYGRVGESVVEFEGYIRFGGVFGE